VPAGRAGCHPLGGWRRPQGPDDGAGRSDCTTTTARSSPAGPDPASPSRSISRGGVSPRCGVPTLGPRRAGPGGPRSAGGRERPDRAMAWAKAGDIGQGELDVEQTLVKQLRRRPVGLRRPGSPSWASIIRAASLSRASWRCRRRTSRTVCAGSSNSFKRQGGHLPRPAPRTTVGCAPGPWPGRGVEQGEPDDNGDDDADPDLGGKPAQVTQRDRAMQEEAEEVANEQHDPG